MRYVGIAAIYAYRYTLGVIFPATCKYHPSCSQYALDALQRYGFVRGSVLAGWRLLRCNPWSHGGVDYVENQKLFRPKTSLAMSTSSRAGFAGTAVSNERSTRLTRRQGC